MNAIIYDKSVDGRVIIDQVFARNFILLNLEFLPGTMRDLPPNEIKEFKKGVEIRGSKNV